MQTPPFALVPDHYSKKVPKYVQDLLMTGRLEDVDGTRLYVRESESVRLVSERMPHGGTRLRVYGPHKKRSQHEFSDPSDCELFQVELERSLLANRFTAASATTDRRSGPERRAVPRELNRRRE
jgi:hypothetical protein